MPDEVVVALNEPVVDIVIPTFLDKNDPQVLKLAAEIEATVTLHKRLIITGQPVSAAKNRNYGLKFCADAPLWNCADHNIMLNQLRQRPLVIMVDDDMTGFFPGWDALLIQPLLDDPAGLCVSARLMNDKGQVGPSCMGNDSLIPPIIEIQNRRIRCMPTASIAHRNVGIRFDENYIGSGFEDNDFMNQMSEAVPVGKYFINNNVRLIHMNQMKAQYENNYFQINGTYFRKKWGLPG